MQEKLFVVLPVVNTVCRILSPDEMLTRHRTSPLSAKHNMCTHMEINNALNESGYTISYKIDCAPSKY